MANEQTYMTDEYLRQLLQQEDIIGQIDDEFGDQQWLDPELRQRLQSEGAENLGTGDLSAIRGGLGLNEQAPYETYITPENVQGGAATGTPMQGIQASSAYNPAMANMFGAGGQQGPPELGESGIPIKSVELPTNWLQGGSIIDQALQWENEILPALQEQGISPEMFGPTQSIDMYDIDRANELGMDIPRDIAQGLQYIDPQTKLNLEGNWDMYNLQNFGGGLAGQSESIFAPSDPRYSAEDFRNFDGEEYGLQTMANANKTGEHVSEYRQNLLQGRDVGNLQNIAQLYDAERWGSPTTAENVNERAIQMGMSREEVVGQEGTGYDDRGYEEMRDVYGQVANLPNWAQDLQDPFGESDIFNRVDLEGYDPMYTIGSGGQEIEALRDFSSPERFEGISDASRQAQEKMLKKSHQKSTFSKIMKGITMGLISTAFGMIPGVGFLAGPAVSGLMAENEGGNPWMAAGMGLLGHGVGYGLDQLGGAAGAAGDAIGQGSTITDELTGITYGVNNMTGELTQITGSMMTPQAAAHFGIGSSGAALGGAGGTAGGFGGRVRETVGQIGSIVQNPLVQQGLGMGSEVLDQIAAGGTQAPGGLPPGTVEAMRSSVGQMQPGQIPTAGAYLEEIEKQPLYDPMQSPQSGFGAGY